MSRRRRRRNPILNAIALGLSGGFLALVVLLAAAVIVVPLATGSIPLTVLTSSMEPKLPPGTLVIVKPTPVNEIRVGDVMTYQLYSGRPEVVTHRVVERIVATDGTTSFITQGDANAVPDQNPVQEVQVRGTVWYSVPLLGWVNTWLTGERRATVVPILAGLLFLYAAWMLVAGFRDRRRKLEKDRLREERVQQEAEQRAAAEAEERKKAAIADAHKIAQEAEIPPLLLR